LENLKVHQYTFTRNRRKSSYTNSKEGPGSYPAAVTILGAVSLESILNKYREFLIGGNFGPSLT
jgi:hypothetical protein